MSTASPTGRPSSRCWTLVGAAGSLDVEVHAPDDALLGDVLTGLADALGGSVPPLWSGSSPLGADTDLRSPALAHGAALGIGRPGPRPARDPAGSALALEFVGGPEAGRSVPLTGGRHVVGRGSTADVAVDDSDVSRRHVVVDVAAGRVTVRDAGSANGSSLDGVLLAAEPAEWSQGAVLGMGSSGLTIRGPGGARLPGQAVTGGRTLVHPVAVAHPARAETEVRFPAEPDAPTRRRLAWAAVALPAVAGALGAWLFAAPTFLFFALLGPLVALGSWLGDRWSGGRTHRRAAAAHADELAAARHRLEAAVRADRQAVDQAAPDLARLTAAARRRSAPLWERRGTDEGAFTVRLGRGPGTSRVIRVAADGTRSPAPCDDLPVTVDLALTGGLTVVAPRPRSLGVARAVLAQACALLPPGDLSVALVTSPERLGDWKWLRWLPHVDPADVRVAPAAHDPGRALGPHVVGRDHRSPRGAGLPTPPRSAADPLARRRARPCPRPEAGGRPALREGGRRPDARSRRADAGRSGRRAPDRRGDGADRRAAAARGGTPVPGGRPPAPADGRAAGAGPGATVDRGSRRTGTARHRAAARRPARGPDRRRRGSRRRRLVPCAGPAGRRPGQVRRGRGVRRPVPRRPARTGGRHDRRRQVRAAAVASSRGSRSPIRRTAARSCSSTTRVAPPSPRPPASRTPWAW